MRTKILWVIAGVVILISLGWAVLPLVLVKEPGAQPVDGIHITLPDPVMESSTSLEAALAARRSIRDYQASGLSLEEVAQLLWAAQGVTHPAGYRTAPSAGALYPLEVYLIAGDVEDLQSGVYRYLPPEHALTMTLEGDVRAALAEAALGQTWVREAPASLLITGVFERSSQRYGARGERYVYIEAGAAAQNVSLQAISLGLGTVFVGAFLVDRVHKVAGLLESEIPLVIIPAGRK